MSINDILKLPQFNALNVSCEKDTVWIHGELKETDKTCPACGKEAEKPHQYYEKQVRHLSFGNLPTYLVFQRKDWICECGKVFLERLDFQDLYSQYTKPYQQYVYELAKKQDLKRVSELEKLSWAIVQDIVKKKSRLNAEKLAEEGVKLSTTLHIDEIALKKGHSNFETIIYTEDEILETMCGKKSTDLQTVLKSIVGVDRIKQVCIDMCAPFADAIRTALSDAIIVVDRFHVVKLLNKTLEKLRCQTDRKLKAESNSREKELKTIENEEKQLEKELKMLLKEEDFEKIKLKERQLMEKQKTLQIKKAEIKENYKAASMETKRFCNIRFLLSKSYGDLHKDERRLVRQYLRLNKEMQKVYWLCQDFRKILFSKEPLTETEASTQLTDWCTKAQKYLGHFVKTLATWWSEVVNACIYPLNNGRAEGFNNKIKLVKRMGFGFRNRLNFKFRIQAACNP